MDPSGVRLPSIATLARCQRNVRSSPDSDQIADALTRRIKSAPATPEKTREPQGTPMRRQRPRDGATNEAPMSPVEAQSEPWWIKPVLARKLLERSWASSERVLFRGLKSASSPEASSKTRGLYARCSAEYCGVLALEWSTVAQKARPLLNA
jgi:hypothetical protein